MDTISTSEDKENLNQIKSESGSARSSKKPRSECNSNHNQQTQQPFKAMSSSQLSAIMSEEVLKVDKDIVVDMKSSSNLAGSTALFAIRILDSNQLLVANIGDSRGVLCSSRGMPVPLSFDHKPQSVSLVIVEF